MPTFTSGEDNWDCEVLGARGEGLVRIRIRLFSKQSPPGFERNKKKLERLGFVGEDHYNPEQGWHLCELKATVPVSSLDGYNPDPPLVSTADLREGYGAMVARWLTRMGVPKSELSEVLDRVFEATERAPYRGVGSVTRWLHQITRVVAQPYAARG